MANKDTKLERRMLSQDAAEFRVSASDGDEKQRYVEGYGVVYNREVELWDGYFEEVREGAFAETLASGAEIKSYIDHDPARILATTKSDPALELQDNHYGLRYKVPVPPTTYGDDFIVNLERGNIRGASFTFFVPDGGDIVTRDQKGNIHRVIIRAVLYEVGAVANPAYPMTTAHARSKEDVMAEMAARCKTAETEPQDVMPEPVTPIVEETFAEGGIIDTSAPQILGSNYDNENILPTADSNAVQESERQKEIARNRLYIMKQKLHLIERSAQ